MAKLTVMLMNIFTKWNKNSLIKDLKEVAKIFGGYLGEHLYAMN